MSRTKAKTKDTTGKSLKMIMLGFLVPLILIGQIASSIGAIKNLSDYGNTVLETDLNNGYIAALQSLDSYFWGIEYRMTTMSMTGIIQDETKAGEEFPGTMGILTGLKGANDVITGTVYRSEKGDNLIVAKDTNYKAKGMNAVIEDEYYNMAKENECVWVGPYEDKLTGTITLSVYRSVVDDNDKVVGVIGMNIDFMDIAKYFSEREFSTTGYDIMLKKDGTVLSDKKDMDSLHTKTTNEKLLSIAANSGEESGSIKLNGGDYRYKACDIPRTDWRMISLISAHEHDNVTLKGIIVQVIIMAVVIALSVVLVWIMIGNITKRLYKIKVAMNDAGKGKLTNEVALKNNAKKMDELDVIGDSYNRMINDFSIAIGDTKDTLDQLLEKNAVLKESFEQLDVASNNIGHTMNEVAMVSEEQAKATTDVVGETTELSDNIEAVSGLVTTMKGSCDELKDKTQSGLGIVNNLVAGSDDTIRVTEEITRGINNVDTSSKEIEDIIGLINSVSDQTDLLALNASIEAARAGEAGKGFAVVADEIRNLAEQSQSATADIRNIIQTMQSKIQDTVDAVANVNRVIATQSQNVKETEESFHTIFGGVESLDSLLTEVEGKNTTMVEKKEAIFSSMNDLSAGIEETSASTQEVTNSTQGQAEIIKRLQGLTAEIADCSDQLNAKLSQFTCK